MLIRACVFYVWMWKEWGWCVSIYIYIITYISSSYVPLRIRTKGDVFFLVLTLDGFLFFSPFFCCCCCKNFHFSPTNEWGGTNDVITTEYLDEWDTWMTYDGNIQSHLSEYLCDRNKRIRVCCKKTIAQYEEHANLFLSAVQNEHRPSIETVVTDS